MSRQTTEPGTVPQSPHDSVTSLPVLCIDADALSTRLLARRLVPLGFDVHIATTGIKGLLLAMTQNYALIFLELRLPDMSGGEVCECLRRIGISAPVALVTASANVSEIGSMIRLGIIDIFQKPLSDVDVVALARRCISVGGASHALLTPLSLEAAVHRRVMQLLLTTPELSLDHVARRLELERHVIEKSIRAHTGQSFRAWRRRFEMERAADILCISDVPIKAIACDLGYASQRSFARAFVAVTGQSPRRYRDRHSYNKSEAIHLQDDAGRYTSSHSVGLK